MRLLNHHKPLTALLLLALAGAAWGQRGRSPEAVIDRVNRTVESTQRRIDQAQERAARVPDQAARAERAQRAERALRAERAQRAARAEQVRRGQRGAAQREARSRAPLDPGSASARRMAEAQQQRLQDIVLANPRELEMTATGPAVRGQVVAVDPGSAALGAARRAGFTVVSSELVEGLDMRTVTLGTPAGMSVDDAVALLARLAPRAQFAANHLHVQSSAAAQPAPRAPPPLAQGRIDGAPAIGIIDGGVARHPALTGPVEQRGFVRGAPRPNGHATAIASLAAGNGRLRGASPGASLLVADIYGSDPAGGSAVALVRALGWMVARRVPVVATALSGPPNPLVERAVARANQRGVYVVAPVGNAGPAAPPAFPASYSSVVAVTGVDARHRLLIESGRSPGIDYAAPGAGMLAGNLAGGFSRVRGTSFAVPFVAARLSRALTVSRQPLPLLDREAVDLGARGPDNLFGRGLLCAGCATR